MPPPLPGDIAAAPVLRLASVDGANAEAARRAKAGERGPLWVLAETQTAGRGRSGRRWDSPPGNLYATLLLTPGRPEVSKNPPLQEIAALSYAAALAVAEAAGAFLDPRLIRLKWPNDVLINERKLSGVLLETGGGPAPWLAIGMGVNLAHHPPQTPDGWPAACLGQFLDAPPTPETFLDPLAAAMDHWFSAWRARGFAALRGPWLLRAARLGETIRARTPMAEHVGVFETVDETGALVLRAAKGRLRIHAADVHFGAELGI